MMKTRLKRLLWPVALVVLGVGWGWWSLGGGDSGAAASGGSQVAAPQPRTSLQQLLASSPAQIAQCDIALLNLVCAVGLPGAENLDPQDCIAVLAGWAERVRSETERHLYRYKANPREFESSEGYFRMLMMAVVLYEDFSVRYNPARIGTPGALDPNDHFFADSRDVFLHGLVGSRVQGLKSKVQSRSAFALGTCSSMPVLYVALGRRLGYPLKLATTKAHVFLRWEGAGERFDLEATGKGMNRYDDEHFKQWPYPVTEEEIQADGYLKSLTPVEELALFLSLRGHCLKEAGRMSEAVASYAEAVRLAPACRPYRLLLAAAQHGLAHPGSGAGVPPASAGSVPHPISPPPGYAQAAPLLRPPSPGPGPLPGAPPDPNPLLKIRQQ